MVQIYKDESGQEHEFPDDATPQEIDEATSRPSSSQSNSGLLQKAANFAERNINQPIEQNVVNPLNDFASGFNQGIANIPSGVANLGIYAANKLPGVNANYVKQFDFAPNNTMSTLGEVGSFFGGGELGKAGNLLTHIPSMSHLTQIPFMAKAISHATNILKESPFANKVAGNAVLGGTYASPGNEGEGMVLGGAIPAVGETGNALSSSAKSIMENPKVHNFLSKFMPEKLADETYQGITGGKSLYETNKDLVNDIRQGHDMRQQEANVYKDYVMNKHGNDVIYESPDPLISTETDKSTALMNKIKSLGAGDLYKAFESNPTLSNAHQLQSELGSMMGDLKNSPVKTADTRNEISKIKSARDQLKQHMFDYLKDQDQYTAEKTADMYKRYSDLFKENVEPYLSNKKLKDIVNNGKTYVKNLHDVFAHPSNTFNRFTGKEETGKVNKILQDLPQESQNKILALSLGSRPQNANSLLDKLSKAEDKGYGNYLNENIKNNMNELGQRIGNKNKAKIAGKTAGVGAATGASALGMNSLYNAGKHAVDNALLYNQQ